MKISILFVDDNPGITSNLKRIFRKTGYQITTANSGEQALAIMDRQQFTVVVSDQCMPGMEGACFLNRAHLKQPKAIQMMFSADADIVANDDALKGSQIREFILKPCFDDELINYIDRAVQTN